jgi:hypothetical protein
VAKYTRPEQRERALEILETIAPAGEELEERKANIVWASGAVTHALRTTKSLPSPSKQREWAARRKRLLLGAITAARRAWPGNPCVNEFRAIDECSRTCPPKHARQYQHHKMYAVVIAKVLIERCGQEPARSRVGNWHVLAQVLYGDDEADLFDYIEELEMDLDKFLEKKSNSRR